MPRTKTGVVRRRKHKKILKLAKGFRGTNNRLYKRANEAVLHSLSYAYTGRKLRKRDLRKLWIIRIGGALKNTKNPINYSTFIHKLKENKIELNRKMLSEISIRDFETFDKIVKSVS